MALAALEKGAVEIITKPKWAQGNSSRNRACRICDAIKSAARARPRRRVAPRFGAWSPN